MYVTSAYPFLPSSLNPSELPRIVRFIVTDNEGASSEAVVARVNFNAIDNKPTIDLNGPELPGQNVSVVFIEGSPAVMVSDMVCLVDVKYECSVCNSLYFGVGKRTC